MDRNVLFAIISGISFSVVSLAADHQELSHQPSVYDHFRVDYHQATNLAYQLADLGERWAYETNHYGLSRAAHDLHNAASELYHFLRGQAGRGWRYDHSPINGTLDRILYRAGSAVENFAYFAPIQPAQHARSFYRSLQYSLQR